MQTLRSDERTQLLARLEAHRDGVRASLADLDASQARARMVPSATTLLGLVAHLTYVERVWSQEAGRGVPRTELGLPAWAPDSFVVADEVSVAEVLDAHAAAVAEADAVWDGHGLDDVVTGHALGPMTVRWVLLHLLDEYSQHHGHADILREQVLTAGARPA